MLNPDQRRWRADKLGDLANYTAASFLLGQFLTQDFRLDLTLIGLGILFSTFLYTNLLLRGMPHDDLDHPEDADYPVLVKNPKK